MVKVYQELERIRAIIEYTRAFGIMTDHSTNLSVG